jgi:hypothetical protein
MMTLLRLCPVAAAVLVIGSCAPPAEEGGFDSGNPAARIYAIEQAARAGDSSPQTLRAIVEQLDCDDPAVRFVAIHALQRLTGQTHGYRLEDPPEQRRQAIECWVSALEADPADAPSPQASGGAEDDD